MSAQKTSLLGRIKAFFAQKPAEPTPEEKADEYVAKLSYYLKQNEDKKYTDVKENFKALTHGELTLAELIIISKEDMQVSPSVNSDDFAQMVKDGIRAFDRRYFSQTSAFLTKEQIKARLYFSDIAPLPKPISSALVDALAYNPTDKKDLSFLLSEPLTDEAIHQIHVFDFRCLNNTAAKDFVFNERVIKARLILAEAVPLPTKVEKFIQLMLAASPLSADEKTGLIQKFLPRPEEKAEQEFFIWQVNPPTQGKTDKVLHHLLTNYTPQDAILANPNKWKKIAIDINGTHKKIRNFDLYARESLKVKSYSM